MSDETNADAFRDYFFGGPGCQYVKREDERYRGRSFYDGPAIVVDRADLDTVESISPVPLTVDNLGMDYIVYPKNPRGAVDEDFADAMTDGELEDVFESMEDAWAEWEYDRRVNASFADKSLREKAEKLEKRWNKLARDHYRGIGKPSDLSDERLVRHFHEVATLCFYSDHQPDALLRRHDRLLDEAIERGLDGCVYPSEDSERPRSKPLQPGEVAA